MEQAKLNVIRFGNEDIVATSCGTVIGNSDWTQNSYWADNDSSVHADCEEVSFAWVYSGYAYNDNDKLNGNTVPLGSNPLEKDHYYHFKKDLSPNDDESTEWWECTDSSHHHPED